MLMTSYKEAYVSCNSPQWQLHFTRGRK